MSDDPKKLGGSQIPDPGPQIPDAGRAYPVPSGRKVIERLATATGEWQLQRRDGHYEIICNGVFLMASYNRHSGRQLATLALRRIRGDGLHALVGGLGIGFTAQVALEDPRVSRLEVVEVEPVIVAWHRAYFAAFCRRPCEDPRTILIEADLYEMFLPPQSYDAILLDTDNGPDWLAREVNDRLYRPETVDRFLTALTPRGVLACWSAAPSPAFATALDRAGAHAEAIETSDEIAPGRRGSVWLYFARSRI